MEAYWPMVIVLCFGLGAPLLALAGLLARRREFFSFVPVILLAGIILLTAVAYLGNQSPLVYGFPLLMGGSAVFSQFHAHKIPGLDLGNRRFVSQVLWGAVLLGCPGLAFDLAAREDRVPTWGDDDFQFTVPPEQTREYYPGFTDKGRTIRLFHVQGVSSGDPQFLEKQKTLLRHLNLDDKVIPLGIGWHDCNCHGWVFTGGRFFVETEDMPLLLEDNGYVAVADPRPGDLAIYRNPDGNVNHTGQVRFVEGKTVLVESKWSLNGVFLHPVDLHMYNPATCTFYRSSGRYGHLLHTLPDI